MLNILILFFTLKLFNETYMALYRDIFFKTARFKDDKDKAIII